MYIHINSGSHVARNAVSQPVSSQQGVAASGSPWVAGGCSAVIARPPTSIMLSGQPLAVHHSLLHVATYARPAVTSYVYT